MKKFDLIVVGGGAAGFYGAVQAAEMKKGVSILILEKSNKVLSKVRVSGGGRCNVTHHCFDPVKLSHHYPRGAKQLRNLFREHDAEKTISWFASKGVELKTEADGRMFPVTDSSETIIDCFIREAQRLNINVELGSEVIGVRWQNNEFEITTASSKAYLSKKLLIAAGGSPKPEAYRWIQQLGHTVRAPIPSLFTFNDSGKRFADLMGISVPHAEVRIATTGFLQRGPLLITHWGLSGPAVIKLSAWAAEYLHSVHYNFTALVSWIGTFKEEDLRDHLKKQKLERSRQKIYSHPLFDLPQRLWIRLCELSEIDEDKIWGDLALRNLNKLLENLIKCPFNVEGKTTFKEEFVTCGGVNLADLDLESMESKKVKGLFFAGEVLNVDGETGGFNFQSAWTTAFHAARAIVSSESY